MDGRTDGQGDSYIPPQTLFAGGGGESIMKRFTSLEMDLRTSILLFSQITRPLFLIGSQ
jgi:hypothetical protein